MTTKVRATADEKNPYFKVMNRAADYETLVTGQMIRKDLIQERRNLEATVTELSGEDKASFLDLASHMLQWLPEKRMTAKELLQHPFFESTRKDRERNEKQ